jgi:hypothetical protein
MIDTKAEHARLPEGTEVCWTLVLRPVLIAGARIQDMDLSLPEPTQTSYCTGEYPEFTVVDRGGDCACGCIGDGKAVLDAEHFIGAWIAREGIAAVDLIWYWGNKVPADKEPTKMDVSTFRRLNEGRDLAADTWYRVC